MTPKPTEREAGFVGREPELRELRRGLDEALAGSGQLFFLVGEPGIGKTRLAEQIARLAARAGAQALWGRCFEGGGAPPYWPWIQVLRAGRPEHADAVGGPAAAGLRELLPTVPSLDALDSEEARFQLFDAAATLLRRASAEAPLVVLLDDLQWADDSSLLLLGFLARELRDARVVLVACYRDVEARLSAQAGRRIAELACDARTIRLGGLAEEEVALLLERSTGAPPAASLVRSVRRATEGNPLFVEEVGRSLAARPSPEDGAPATMPLPERVRAVIGRRIGLLSPACRRVLSVAAVLGKELDLATLEQACAADGDAVLEAIDEAVRARVVASAEGRLSFVHDLFRETLYDELTPRERARLHAEVGFALERVHAGALELRLPELARHFFLAGPAQSERAVRYALRAAARAAFACAYGEAVAHYRSALEALASGGGEAPVERCRVLLSLGESLWSAGEFDEARSVFEEAADLAEALGRSEDLARAALGFGGHDVSFDGGVVEPRLIRLLERGLAATSPEDGVLRASLMGRLAAALAYSDQRARAAELARAAVAMARRLDHEPTLCLTLNCFLAATWGPDGLDERLAVLRETTALAARVGGSGVAELHAGLMTLLLETGDAAAAEREAESYRRRTETFGRRISTWILAVRRTTIALLEGRFSEVEALATEALRLGNANGNALQYYGAQMLALRREQGRLDEMLDAIAAFVAQYPAVPAWRAALAWAYVELGRDDDGRRELDGLAARDFADLPRDMFWLLTLWLATEVVDRLGDTERAAVLYPLLVPFADRCVTSGAAFCGGSLQRPLGVLASLLGRYDDAESHFAAAEAANERISGRPWLAYLELDRARMLRARGRDGDGAAAVEHLRRAAEAARALGMTSLLARVEQASAETASPARGGHDEAVLRREGEYWTVAYGGHAARVRDARGLRLIALLLASPGREFRATDLAAWPPPPLVGQTATRGAVAQAGLEARRLGDGGTAPDAQALAAYRTRLESLRDEAEEAERFNDPLRAARAREEMARLAGELRAARGSRRRGDTDAERARLSVTKAIRYAIRKVERAHPPLASILAATVKTGASCRYEPDVRTPVRWVL